MNKIKVIVIVLIWGIPFNSFGQKFRTIEQYQNYFLENYKTLNEIEGIWYVNLNMYADGIFQTKKEFTVVINNEKNQYFQYTFEDGYYKPDGGYKAFNASYLGYKCSEYDDQCDISMDSYTFIIKNNNFTYDLDATQQINCKSGKNWRKKIIKKYSYSKIYPLESDLSNIKQIEEKANNSTGSGFAISSEGYIVTNYHVVENAKNIKIKGIKGNFSKSYHAKVVVSDRNNDLVILEIDDSSFITLGDINYTINSTTSKVGENIFVLGYPLTATMGEEIKLTNGIISSKSGYQGDITSYQMTAPIQPGNSGAPMFDENGNIIGIVNAKHTKAENAGYAIKTNYLFNLIDASPVSIKLPTYNKLIGKTLSNQVNLVKDFIYIVEVN